MLRSSKGSIAPKNSAQVDSGVPTTEKEGTARMEFRSIPTSLPNSVGTSVEELEGGRGQSPSAGDRGMSEAVRQHEVYGAGYGGD